MNKINIHFQRKGNNNHFMIIIIIFARQRERDGKSIWALWTQIYNNANNWARRYKIAKREIIGTRRHWTREIDSDVCVRSFCALKTRDGLGGMLRYGLRVLYSETSKTNFCKQNIKGELVLTDQTRAKIVFTIFDKWGNFSLKRIENNI